MTVKQLRKALKKIILDNPDQDIKNRQVIMFDAKNEGVSQFKILKVDDNIEDPEVTNPRNALFIDIEQMTDGEIYVDE